MTLVSTVVTLARAFGMRTVAEGVETPEQLRLLRQSGCDQAQGYLYARPTAAAEVREMIGRLRVPGILPILDELRRKTSSDGEF
jgi:diguanylate cyclase